MILALVCISHLTFWSLPQNPPSDRSRDCTSTCSLFVNEAAFASASTNNRHVHHKRNDPSAHNCLNTLLARSNSRRSPTVKTPQSTQSDPQGWLTGKLELQQTSSGKSISVSLCFCHPLEVKHQISASLRVCAVFVGKCWRWNTLPPAKDIELNHKREEKTD